MIRPIIFMASLLVASYTFGQVSLEDEHPVVDTTLSEPQFSVISALDYVQQVASTHSLWRSKNNSVQMALFRLLDHTTEPYDSIREQLTGMDFQSIDVTRKKILVSDSTEIRWLNDSTFIIDSLGWNLDLLLRKESQIRYPVDFSTLAFSDSILNEKGMLDSTLFIPDTILVAIIDTAALKSLNIPLHQYSNQKISPPVYESTQHGSSYISIDSGYVVHLDTTFLWMASQESPFLYLSGRHQLDSLQFAVKTLVDVNERRDSTRLIINDMYGQRTPLWITTGHNDSHRFWVKNYKNDSITLWIGNPTTNEISLLLEDDIDVNRMMTEEMDHLPKTLQQPDRTLAKMSLLEPNPIFWDYEFSSAITFNQTYLSNWAKGGESSLTTMLDMFGSATYNNKEANTQWINNMRLKFGTLVTEEKGLRKNNDLLEINSKFNRNASGKIGLSASFYFKNQIAKGYNYPNDSVIVSKFLNPASLTIGLGAEYKPFKNTTLNMAPLSYKNTFVLDTGLIDQTKHGIDQNKRAKQELGTQIVLVNTITPMEDLKVTNRLRLFSNYLNKPENIDVDWEMLLDKKISWFFTIRLNLQLIYDDDIRFTLYDSDDQPILLPDGSPRKVAKAQFKEFVGLSLLFKF
ncbi:MAG: DUF3078 domain-containing protein [Bacteroidota bacterium]